MLEAYQLFLSYSLWKNLATCVLMDFNPLNSCWVLSEHRKNLNTQSYR